MQGVVIFLIITLLQIHPGIFQLKTFVNHTDTDTDTDTGP